MLPPDPTNTDLANYFQELQVLSKQEMVLWRLLWEAKGTLVSQDTILEKMIGDSAVQNYVSTYLGRLRRKLPEWEIITEQRRGVRMIPKEPVGESEGGI